MGVATIILGASKVKIHQRLSSSPPPFQPASAELSGVLTSFQSLGIPPGTYWEQNTLPAMTAPPPSPTPQLDVGPFRSFWSLPMVLQEEF